MQKRHFDLIAATIANMSVPDPLYRHYVANHFANALQSTNPRFDRARFLKACMGEA